MEVRLLNLLLILVFVFQGLCDPLEIPVPVPRPVIPHPPDPIIPAPRPIPEPIPAPGTPNGQYPLGTYFDNNKQAPFADLTGEWDQFFSKVDDILEAAGSKGAGDDNNPNEPGGGPGNGGPTAAPTSITYTITDFCSPVGGSCVTIPTYTTVFDPAQPTNACSAWSSLSVYCSGAGTNCACHSGAYYVPDQWNSLAAACAKAVTGCPPPSSLAPSPPPSFPPPPSLVVPTFISVPTFHPPPTFIPVPTLPPAPTFHPPPTLLPPPQILRMVLRAENSGFRCDLVLSASSSTSYCPTNTSTVAFAAVTPSSKPVTPPPHGSAATAIDVPKFKILTTALFLVLSTYRIW